MRITDDRAKNGAAVPTVLVYRRQVLPLSETFIKEQALALRRWHPILIGHQRGHLDLSGLDVCWLGSDKPGIGYRLRRKLKLLSKEALFGSALLWTTRRALRSLKEKRASLVHAHFGTDAIWAWPLAKALGLPLLVTLHGYDVNVAKKAWESGSMGPDMTLYPSYLLRLAQEPKVSFVAVSDALRDRAIAQGIPPHKIAVTYIGVDTDMFIPTGAPVGEREPWVLFVGRLVEKKGCSILISAMATVQKLVPEAQLRIIGDGPLREALERQAKQLGVNADFLGSMRSDGVRSEMEKAAVFCLPSITAENGDAEGLPISILEAQACGVPVVTSARGGATEGIADGLTGFAFAEHDTDALAHHITTLLQDCTLRTSFSVQARDWALSRFAILDCGRKLEARYDEAALRSGHEKIRC